MKAESRAERDYGAIEARATAGSIGHIRPGRCCRACWLRTWSLSDRSWLLFPDLLRAQYSNNEPRYSSPLRPGSHDNQAHEMVMLIAPTTTAALAASRQE